MQRLHIVGGAGSGKSTLARELSVALGTPAYYLDALNFIGATERARPYEQRLAAVERIAAEPAWVTEGVFLGWTDALLEAADRIIWLDLPWYIAISRIVRRYMQASRSGTNEYQGLRRLLRFLRWSADYYRRMTPAQVDALNEESRHSRAATARHLRSYRSKVIRCCSPAEVAGLLADLNAMRGWAPAERG